MTQFPQNSNIEICHKTSSETHFEILSVKYKQPAV